MTTDQALQHSGAAGARAGASAARSGTRHGCVEVGDFVVDANAHSITVLGKAIHLTPKEFDLLLHLARHSGKVMTHRALLTSVWEHSPRISLSTCACSSDSCVRSSRLRPVSRHPDRAVGRVPLCSRGLERKRRVAPPRLRIETPEFPPDNLLVFKRIIRFLRVLTHFLGKPSDTRWDLKKDSPTG